MKNEDRMKDSSVNMWGNDAEPCSWSPTVSASSTSDMVIVCIVRRWHLWKLEKKKKKDFNSEISHIRSRIKSTSLYRFKIHIVSGNPRFLSYEISRL